MKIFKIQCSFLLLLLISSISVYSQTNIAFSTKSTPAANNFSYPQSVFVDSQNGHIWVSDFSNNRILRFDVSALTSVKESNASTSPAGFYLGQNYPNPFNPSTQITFSTKSTGNVVLKVYNPLGQTIATLFNEVATANTVYSLTFDAKALPSGIYLYSLRTPNGCEVKKMCLLK